MNGNKNNPMLIVGCLSQKNLIEKEVWLRAIEFGFIRMALLEW
jgi:hypothetical protein